MNEQSNRGRLCSRFLAPMVCLAAWLMLPGCASDNVEELAQKAANTDNCSGTQINYNKNIKPLLENRCTPCHNGGILNGGLRLDTYADAFNAAARVQTRVNLPANHPQLMPQGGPKLSDCQLQQINAWIVNGRPE